MKQKKKNKKKKKETQEIEEKKEIEEPIKKSPGKNLFEDDTFFNDKPPLLDEHLNNDIFGSKQTTPAKTNLFDPLFGDFSQVEENPPPKKKGPSIDDLFDL